MLLKCATSNASLIVPDLEDSVPLAEKPKARELIKKHLYNMRAAKGESLTITVRTNSLDSGLFEIDIKEILDKETAQIIDGFCVTKVDTVEMSSEICKYLSAQEKLLGLAQNSIKVIPQIETTGGLVDCKEILSAGKGRFIAAAFGADDFTADFEIHRTEGDPELDFARKYFALCCHARKVLSIDTPYIKFKDTEGLKKELDYLKTIGMKAKFAIHPVSWLTTNAFRLKLISLMLHSDPQSKLSRCTKGWQNNLSMPRRTWARPQLTLKAKWQISQPTKEHQRLLVKAID